MLTYISIIVTAIFINNIVFSQFLGICRFRGVEKKQALHSAWARLSLL